MPCRQFGGLFILDGVLCVEWPETGCRLSVFDVSRFVQTDRGFSVECVVASETEAVVAARGQSL